MNINDIAKLSGYSIATVSRVINGSESVKTETRNLILEIIRKNNYTPSEIARALSLQNTVNIGVIVPDISNEFFSDAFKGISKITEKYSHNVLFFDTAENIDTEHDALRIVERERLSGLIIAPVSSENLITASILERFNDMGLPMVLLDRNIGKIKLDSVFIDNEKAAYDGVTALIKEKHREIAIIKGPTTSLPGIGRYRGYLKALQDNEISVNEKYIVEGDFMYSTAYSRTKELLELNTPPTAIFCSNNLSSLGCLKYITESSYKLGETISLLGFDAISAFKIVNFPFSTIERDAVEQGKIAAQLLMDRIYSSESRKKNEVTLKYIPYEVKLRGSEKHLHLFDEC